MSCAVVSPAASPRLGYPAHRSAAPLVSILRSNASRTPLTSPRTPSGANAARIEAAVTDYFSAGIYEGCTRTPLATPAFGLGIGTGPVNSPRIGFASNASTTRGGAGDCLDLSHLDATLACLANASPALSSTQSPYLGSISFAAAGSAFFSPRQPQYHARTFNNNSSPNPSTGLSSRRRPSLRISDLPPLVMPDLHSLDHLSIPSRHDMCRGDSDASATTTCSELTLTGRLEYAGVTPGGNGMVGLGLGASPGGSTVNGKRIPTPYPERKAWIEDGDISC